jgi:DNA polymerase-3 subunit epsilon
MGALSPVGWFSHLKREWLLYHLADTRFRFMWDAPPDNEWVALDCETTGLNVRSDEIISIAAVRILGNRVMASERMELLVRPERRVSAESVRVHHLREQDVAGGMALETALIQLMHFIGSRPLVGYYLEFDLAMINRALFPLLGMGLPQPRNEVSSMYYDYKFRQLPQHQQDRNIDLRFATLMNDLELPLRESHDALNDAIMAALAFIKLRQLLGRVTTAIP